MPGVYHTLYHTYLQNSLMVLTAADVTLESLQLPMTVKTVSWVPQNDVLGHPAVKVFVTQAGINSLYEAIYHAVPVVSVPLIADQPINAQMVSIGGPHCRKGLITKMLRMSV